MILQSYSRYPTDVVLSAFSICFLALRASYNVVEMTARAAAMLKLAMIMTDIRTCWLLLRMSASIMFKVALLWYFGVSEVIWLARSELIPMG